MGLLMLINPDTKWPPRSEIMHASDSQEHGQNCKCRCKCRATPFTDEDLVIKYMHVTAYFAYYQNDPEAFNAWSVNELVPIEAKRLGIDAGNIWEQYPDCVPRPQDLDLDTCPADVPFRVERQVGDGRVIAFEGKTSGPGGCSLTEILTKEGPRERDNT